MSLAATNGQDLLAAINTALANAASASASAATALSTANTAQSTASSAQSTATSAQSTANSAQSTANSAQATANGAAGNFFGGTITNGSTSYVNGSIFLNGEHLVSTNAGVTCDGPWTFSGNVSKASGSFLIDHPLDPAGKYLLHSFVESPDMMNVYNGVITLDASGAAVVALPDWFMALNDTFRYQLTCVGGYAPVYISSEVASNQFGIAGGTPGLKVSWQVTGIRKDAYATANRIPQEVAKLPEDRGRYLHPEVFGHPPTDVVKKGYWPALMATRG